VRNVPANRVVRMPRDIADEQAAASMLKGLTAHFLLRRTYRVRRGETILVHAAAGGVGQLLCQWARALGAKVIGVTGSEAKAELARRNGCRHALVSGRDDIVARVRELTRNEGVSVVYDAVGKDTFMDSLRCLRPLGMMVSFGNASGAPPPISPLELQKHGSLFLTRPALFTYIGPRDQLDRGARELFAALRSGAVRVRIGQKYELAAAADAHRDLVERRTTGSTVLIP
jgi:NADPH2:quinone reductase